MLSFGRLSFKTPRRETIEGKRVFCFDVQLWVEENDHDMEHTIFEIHLQNFKARIAFKIYRESLFYHIERSIIIYSLIENC